MKNDILILIGVVSFIFILTIKSNVLEGFAISGLGLLDNCPDGEECNIIRVGDVHSPCDTSGTWYQPLGERSAETTWRDCRQRALDDGFSYFNFFTNGGCHPSTGADAPTDGGGNKTFVSGSSVCNTRDMPPCNTSGTMYNPLGARSTESNWRKCRQRAQNEGMPFFNYRGRNCYLSTGADAPTNRAADRTSHSGHAACV